MSAFGGQMLDPRVMMLLAMGQNKDLLLNMLQGADPTMGLVGSKLPQPSRQDLPVQLLTGALVPGVGGGEAKAANAMKEGFSAFKDRLFKMISDLESETHRPGIGEVLLSRHGVISGGTTEVDDLLLRRPQDARALYEANEPIRQELRARFGNTVPLFRGIGPNNSNMGRIPGTREIVERPTSFWGTEELARHYVKEGGELLQQEVPVERILHVGSIGDDLEVIILNKDFLGVNK